MNVDRMVLTFPGTFILGRPVLSKIHSSYLLLLTAFVGANLFRASFTGFCPLPKTMGVVGAIHELPLHGSEEKPSLVRAMPG
jgi:hypothetical protein